MQTAHHKPTKKRKKKTGLTVSMSRALPESIARQKVATKTLISHSCHRTLVPAANASNALVWTGKMERPKLIFRAKNGEEN